jgi:hypothetical protein
MKLLILFSLLFTQNLDPWQPATVKSVVCPSGFSDSCYSVTLAGSTFLSHGNSQNPIPAKTSGRMRRDTIFVRNNKKRVVRLKWIEEGK